MRLSAILKRLDEVRGGDQITVFIDEEGVSVEKIVISLFGGSLIKRIDDRTNRCRQARRARRLVGCLRSPEPTQQAHRNGEPSLRRLAATPDGNVPWHGKLRHNLLELVSPRAGTCLGNRKGMGG